MKWIECQNKSPKSKYFQGKVCYEEVYVDDHAASALCWKCVAHMLPADERKQNNKGYPRGWALMKEFVDADGNVFHKGVEQPKLKGKKKPTVIKKTTKKVTKKATKKSLDDKVMEEYTNRLKKKKRAVKKTTKRKSKK